MTWYDAQFSDGVQRYTVGPFDSPDEADEFGRAHHDEQLDYTGCAERKGRQELERLIGARIAKQHSDSDNDVRQFGIVTRWDAGETHGFITDSGNRSWFVSRDDLPDGLTELEVYTRVSFAGKPHPRPGKKYRRHIRSSWSDDDFGTRTR